MNNYTEPEYLHLTLNGCNVREQGAEEEQEGGGTRITEWFLICTYQFVMR
jgi:hypothetical protein